MRTPVMLAAGNPAHIQHPQGVFATYDVVHHHIFGDRIEITLRAFFIQKINLQD